MRMGEILSFPKERRGPVELLLKEAPRRLEGGGKEGGKKRRKTDRRIRTKGCKEVLSETAAKPAEPSKKKD